MADSTESNLQIILQETGGNNNTWGTINNANLQKLVDAVTEDEGIAVTGGTDTLTDNQQRPMYLKFTGILASNEIIKVNDTAKKLWFVYNGTTGSFTLTVQTDSGTGIEVDQGSYVILFSDGTNVVKIDVNPTHTGDVTGDEALTIIADAVTYDKMQDATQTAIVLGRKTSGSGIIEELTEADLKSTFSLSGAPGRVIELAYLPSGENDVIYCDGSAVSRATYALLFAKIATTYGVGDGSTTFNLPDYRGKFRRGFDGGAGNDPDAASRTDRGDGTTGDAIGTNQASSNKQHNHTASTSEDGAHTHTYDKVFTASNDTSSTNQSRVGGFTVTATSSAGDHTHTITVDNDGDSSEARPINTTTYVCLTTGL